MTSYHLEAIGQVRKTLMLIFLELQGQEKDCIEYDAFPENRKLCTVDWKKEYVLRRSAKVDETVTSFIFTHGKPHR